LHETYFAFCLRLRIYAGLEEFLSAGTVAKFITKSSLFLLKFKDAGHAETGDWLCF